MPSRPSDSLLALFEEDDETYFGAAHASSFCFAVRRIIMEFEREYMEYQKPWIRDWLWENCHEELFFLKYACKKSAELKNDMFLVLAVHDVKDLSAEATLPSYYHDFKKKLKEVNEKRCSRDCPAIFSVKTDGNLIHERKRLMDENTRIKADYENREKKFDEKVNLRLYSG